MAPWGSDDRHAPSAEETVPPPGPVPADWVDLATNRPGGGIATEAARRRRVSGPGADRSWRIGADGEAAVADLLLELTEPSWWSRLRGRRPAWRVLHSIPLIDTHGRARGDIDHLLIGPPGVFTINTKHHRTGKLQLHGDDLVLNGRSTDHVPKARREAERAAAALHGGASTTSAGAARSGQPSSPVRPVVVIVGGRLTVGSYADRVTVIMAEQLLHTLRAFRHCLDTDEIDRLYALARRSTTWSSAADRT